MKPDFTLRAYLMTKITRKSAMKNNKGNVPKPGKPQYVPHIINILSESPQTADGKADTRNPLTCLLVMIQIIPIQLPMYCDGLQI